MLYWVVRVHSDDDVVSPDIYAVCTNRDLAVEFCTKNCTLHDNCKTSVYVSRDRYKPCEQLVDEKLQKYGLLPRSLTYAVQYNVYYEDGILNQVLEPLWVCFNCHAIWHGTIIPNYDTTKLYLLDCPRCLRLTQLVNKSPKLSLVEYNLSICKRHKTE